MYIKPNNAQGKINKQDYKRKEDFARNSALRTNPNKVAQTLEY